jgi:hypothetical protein
MNKTTVHNLLNELDDLSRYCIERVMDQDYGDEYEYHSDGQQEYRDKHKEIRKLIGGQYGTNDTCVYSGIMVILDIAREAQMWQQYAMWLENELENERDEYGVNYFHTFDEWYEKHHKWDKEK